MRDSYIFERLTICTLIGARVKKNLTVIFLLLSPTTSRMKEVCINETEYGVCCEELNWCLEEHELMNPNSTYPDSGTDWANTECKTSELVFPI